MNERQQRAAKEWRSQSTGESGAVGWERRKKGTRGSITRKAFGDIWKDSRRRK